MKVQEQILKKLVCSLCKEYLSVAPVLLLPNNKSVCGRCTVPDEQNATRMLPYEYLAEGMLFPCRYQRYGCHVTANILRLKLHEGICNCKAWPCVIQPTCKWRGLQNQVLQHCKETHPEQILSNPATFDYKFNETFARNYLMKAFNMLFVIRTNVCMETQKVNHWVHLLTDSGTTKYDATLDIFNANNRVTKKCDVTGNEFTNENDALAVGIDNLIGILGNATRISFKLRVNKTKPVPEMRCSECHDIITYKLAYLVSQNKWNCFYCVGTNYGCDSCCSYTDTFCKLTFHNWYYCNYAGRTCCKLCCNTDEFSTLEEHYNVSHAELMRPANVAWLENLTERVIFVHNKLGLLHCRYWYHKNRFFFEVATPLHSGDVHFYTCVLELENPVTGHTSKRVMPVNIQDADADWRLIIKMDEFNLLVHNKNVIMKIVITKTKQKV